MKHTTHLLFTSTALMSGVFSSYANSLSEPLPNVIYIMADDLGLGDLGCYGQRYITTPAIDSLARTGIRFARHYSGSTVSAPSRCSLMTGKHTGHCDIRGNIGTKGFDGENYDHPLAAEEVTVAEIMKQRNYVTACIGKWGMGAPRTHGVPLQQGFDYFFGYLGQANAHRYYPKFLWENDTKIELNKEVYSHDLIMEKALSFIADNAEKPFFLYLTPTIPHADLALPEGELGRYDQMFAGELPYLGKGYKSQPRPKATFAAMVSRLDRDVMRVMNLLHEKGIDKNTIIIFTSDNGTHIEGGHDPYFFNSNGGFRGVKRDLYEGGIRTPFIVSWPAKIKEGRVSSHLSAFWDFLPTMCDLIGVAVPKGVDGISYLPTIIERKKQKEHDYLYWEFHEQGGKQAVLQNNWKLIRFKVNKPQGTYCELYDLAVDPTERMNVATQYPYRVAQMSKLMDKAHVTNPSFSFVSERK